MKNLKTNIKNKLKTIINKTIYLLGILAILLAVFSLPAYMLGKTHGERNAKLLNEIAELKSLKK